MRDKPSQPPRSGAQSSTGPTLRSSPRGRPRKIVMLTFPGAHLVDIGGPMALFASAAQKLEQEGRFNGAAYTLELVAERPGPVVTSCGLEIVATAGYKTRFTDIDTLIVAGGNGVHAAVNDAKTVDWLRRATKAARRIASTCNGALLLAEAGLLDGRRATTHWSDCAQLAAHYPKVTVEEDPIFIRDGRVYTSAGVTAGMDLTLALIEEDWGPELSFELSRNYVLYLRRSGGQAQFSAALAGQRELGGRLKDIVGWMLENLHRPLTVPILAERAGMTERSFARHFTAEMGETPAAFVAAARLDAARRTLIEQDLPIDLVARRCGFGGAERLRRTFLRRLKVTPSQFRRHFARRGSDIGAELMTGA